MNEYKSFIIFIKKSHSTVSNGMTLSVKQTEANNVFTPTNKFLGVYTGINLFLHISH